MWKWRGGFSKREANSVALHNEQLRQSQLRASALQRKYPSHDHFVPLAVLPFLGAAAYTQYYHWRFMGEGTMVRHVEREKFDVQDEGAYKLFSRD
eukprot:CAMPEP_0117445322 /NCGR_PEP_ID=MMETSP0759-20121206/5730_1 /TAXON_ID=63605 /ORGANISM="Percolomonas cosmopolitus, Strain WS" /LENGTH=94 /DNA_ID=CAMNT_0005237483 /DNA_START=285 /DNA_END=569 /DNA_ORIENTATION=-